MDNQFAEAISHESRIDYDKSQNALGAEEELYYMAASPRLSSELLGGNESFKNNRPASSSICQAGTILRTIFPIIDQLLDKQTSPRHVESLLDSAREYENVMNARLNSGNVNPNRLKHIKTVRTDQQGADLETFNRLVIKIFQQKLKDWGTLALIYVKIYIIAVQGFIEIVIIEFCPTTIRNKLQDYLAKEIETYYQKAEKIIKFFVKRERITSIYRINPKLHIGLRARVKKTFNRDGNNLTENAKIRLNKA